MAGLMLLSACGKQTETGSTTQTQTSTGRTEVKYWCPYTGDSADFIDTIINEFNEKQDKYTVVREYNGGYYDQIAKLMATDQSGLPALCNSSSETVGSYLHSGLIVNVQDFIDKDKDYKVNLYGNLLATYGVNGKLVGYPLGLSLSGFFYNADVFKKAGIDPYSLTSMDALKVAAEKICDGGYAKYALAEEHSGIWSNYAFAREGFYCVDNNNGSTGLPTKCLYNDNSNGFNDVVKEYFSDWAELSAKGDLYPFGAKIKDELIPAMASGDLAMIVTTNSYLNNVKGACSSNNSNYGFVPMFSVTDKGKNTGYCSSGNGFFVVNNGNTEAQQGAWEFIKYFTSVDVQLRWDTMTGYLPLYDEIYKSADYQAFLKDHPEIQKLIDAIQKADNSAFYAFTATNNEYTLASKDCLEAVLNGGNVNDAINTMCETINNAFALYNKTNK